MTDLQAKRQTLAFLKNHREDVLDHVYDYLWMTLSDQAANYLSDTGALVCSKSASSVKCELTNVLASLDIDPGPLIVKKAGKHRVRVSYKGLSLSTHIQHKGRHNIRHR